jgi:hypothetical protein
MNAFRILPFSPHHAGRFILALLVLVSSLAWLPPTVQAAPLAETSAAKAVSAAVELNARIDGQRLYLAASGLPRNHIFTVRARWHSYDSWVRIARVASNRNGALQKNIRLPSYLARAYRLNVCLKDVVTGRTYCTRARRRY